MQQLATRAQVLVFYSIRPGRSSYSIFVEAHSADRDEADGSDAVALNHPEEDPSQAHQARLFRAAVEGILELERPMGPGRLAFAAVPGYAAAEMLAALREAGYGNLYDAPCLRYSLAASSAALSLPPWTEGGGVSGGEGGTRGASDGDGEGPVGRSPDGGGGGQSEEHDPQSRPDNNKAGTRPVPYVLDTLRTEADVMLVDRYWTFRSPYSLPLIRSLVAHRPTACVRLRTAPADGHPAASCPAGSVVPAEPPGSDSGSGSTPQECDGTASGYETSSSDAVAWILQGSDGALGMAHTLAAHRRRGLMRRCVMDLVRRELRLPSPSGQQPPAPPVLVLDGCGKVDRAVDGGGSVGVEGAEGAVAESASRAPAGVGEGAVEGLSGEQEVYMFVVQGNTTSSRLFESLGFRCSPVHFHWLGVEGHTGETEEEEQEDDKREEEQQTDGEP